MIMQADKFYAEMNKLESQHNGLQRDQVPMGPTPPASHPQPPNHTHTQPHPACPQLPGSLLSSSFPRRAVVSAAAVHSPVRLTAGCHAWVALQDIYNTTIDALKRSQAYETVRTEEMINPV